MMDLVSVTDIAAMLGLSRQRINQLTRTEDFPEPVAVLARRACYRREDIQEWAERDGRAVLA